jgi:hypothetical protein
MVIGDGCGIDAVDEKAFHQRHPGGVLTTVLVPVGTQPSSSCGV